MLKFLNLVSSEINCFVKILEPVYNDNTACFLILAKDFLLFSIIIRVNVSVIYILKMAV